MQQAKVQHARLMAARSSGTERSLGASSLCRHKVTAKSAKHLLRADSSQKPAAAPQLIRDPSSQTLQLAPCCSL